MVVLDTIYAYGHENILCTHNTTIEITKDSFLTRKGNCILGIKASKACNDLNIKLKNLIKQGKKLKITIKTEDFIDIFYGYGNEKLTLLSNKDVIFRKSGFICDRTALIYCTKSAINLNRQLINSIRFLKKKIIIIFEFNDSDEY
ncbi:MAG: DUF371 domain-containing protein [Promethearchaeota archaeon]